MKQPEAEHRSW